MKVESCAPAGVHSRRDALLLILRSFFLRHSALGDVAPGAPAVGAEGGHAEVILLPVFTSAGSFLFDAVDGKRFSRGESIRNSLIPKSGHLLIARCATAVGICAPS